MRQVALDLWKKNPKLHGVKKKHSAWVMGKIKSADMDMFALFVHNAAVGDHGEAGLIAGKYPEAKRAYDVIKDLSAKKSEAARRRIGKDRQAALWFKALQSGGHL
jgi:hypothetical protein